MELEQWAKDLGLAVESFTLDGNIHRFGKNNNQWYVGWEAPFKTVITGDWRTNKRHEYKSNKKRFSQEEKEVAAIQLKSAMDQAKKIREEAQKAAAEKARQELSLASPIGQHAYLEKKRVGAFGVFFKDGILMVPTVNFSNELTGYQRIYADGKKLFLKDQKISETFHRIDGTDECIYICEGYATGASIHMATKATVFCSFSANNLPKVAVHVRDMYKDARIVVAGDDDHATEGNPGRTKADEAATKAACAAVFPDFRDHPEKGTDFNDVHVTFGIDVLSKQLDASENEILYRPLGRGKSACYYYNYKIRDINKFTTWSNVQFYALAPIEHWESRFPNPRGKESSVNWEQAKSDMTQECSAVGLFDPTKVRGCGVWEDKGRIVVNTGKELIVNNTKIPHTRFSGGAVYVDSMNRVRVPKLERLTAEEGKLIADVCGMFQWRNKKSSVYLAGWLAIARVAGALPIRPHVWLTGGAGTGKSSLLEGVIKVVLGNEKERLYCTGSNSSEAGIRQSINADSIPVILDEFEATTMTSLNRIDQILELARMSWSQSDAMIIKGSADGSAVSYRTAFCSLVASIRVSLSNDADRSRFTVIELDQHNGDEAAWKRTRELMASITDEMVMRLFIRSIEMTQTVIKNHAVFKSVLSNTFGMGQRFGDQYGMLLGGYWMLTSDTVVTREEAENFIKGMDFEDDTEHQEIVTDHEECLDQILTTKIRVDGAKEAYSEESPTRPVSGHTDLTVGQIIASDNLDWLASLRTYGIVVEDVNIYVANNHAELRRHVFKGTRWERDWKKSLRRLPFARPANARRFEQNKETIRCTVLNRKSVTEIVTQSVT